MRFLILILIFLAGCGRGTVDGKEWEVVSWDFTEYRNRQCRLYYKKKEDQDECILYVMSHSRDAREYIYIVGDQGKTEEEEKGDQENGDE